jgi:hypothetical protein
MMKLFFNPFEKYSEKILAPIGIMVYLFGSYLATICHANFDGLFDLHFTESTLSFGESLFQNGIDLLTPFVFLMVVGLVINRKTRPIDILSAVLISRIPLYFVSLFNMEKTFSMKQEATLKEITRFAQEHIGLLMVFGLVVLLAVIWMITLLYNGFKVATNAKGPKSIPLFILALIVSEVVSKLIIYLFIL